MIDEEKIVEKFTDDADRAYQYLRAGHPVVHKKAFGYLGTIHSYDGPGPVEYTEYVVLERETPVQPIDTEEEHKDDYLPLKPR
jgi:hypothetical protein